MSSGIDITRGRYATFLETTQSRALGQRITDNKSQRVWTYVRFDGALNVGDWVRDQVTVDLVTVDTNQVYASVDIGTYAGTHRLLDTGAFDDKDYVGAIGQIVVGAGVGQTFFIQEMVSDDEVRISLLRKADGFLGLEDNRGWAVAIDDDSKYVLRFPGAVLQVNMNQSELGRPFGRGFVQQPIASTDIGKYGYVCSRGLCYARILLTDADVPVMGEGMTYSGGGRIQGFTAAGTTAGRVSRQIAVSQHGDLTLSPDTGDALIMVEAQIDDSTMAFRLTDDSDPRARTRIG